MKQDPRFKGVPGRIREPGKPGDLVWIGGRTRDPRDSIYNPAPPAHVRRCLSAVMEWMGDADLVTLGDAGMGLPLIVRMAIGHAAF